MLKEYPENIQKEVLNRYDLLLKEISISKDPVDRKIIDKAFNLLISELSGEKDITERYAVITTLETALKEMMKRKLRQEQSQRKTFGPLLNDAVKMGVISKGDSELAGKVKDSGDNSVHDYKRCSAAEALQSLNNTKRLLNTWYQ